MKKLLLIALLVCIKQVNGQIITTVAGNGTQGYSGDGVAATSAGLSATGVFVDGSGNVFISDANNNRIRKVDGSTGIISTIAGNGTPGYAGDDAAATSAELDNPWGVFMDGSGNLFIADCLNNRIRKVNGSTGIISTIAGNGTGGYAGDGAAATSAELSRPTGLFVDGSGNVFIADNQNSRIRKVNGSTGIITTIAGNGTGGYTGDGAAATSAEIYPWGVFVDGSGNVFIADAFNNRIRKVNISTGIISTIAGIGVCCGAPSSYNGDGIAATSAELNSPSGIFVDASGNVFIADTYNARIRKINGSTGIISTIAGNGTPGYAGDGAAATSAELDNPFGVFVDGSGNVFIADGVNSRIRMVCNSSCTASGIEQVKENNGQVNIYPNPTKDVLNVELGVLNEKTTLVITDMLGNDVKQMPFNAQHVTLNISDLSEGVYNLSLQSNEGVVNKRLVVVR